MKKPNRQDSGIFTVNISEQAWQYMGREDRQLQQLIDGPDDSEQQDQQDPLLAWEQLEPLLQQLPPKEADFLELTWRHKKKQQEIADMFGCTQAAVSYRITRALERLQFLAQLPKLTEDQIRHLLAQAKFAKPHDQEILLLYCQLSCQAEVGRQLGIAQATVRSRVVACTRRLARLAIKEPKYSEIARLFEMLMAAGNIRLELKLPQWQNRGPGQKDDRFK